MNFKIWLEQESKENVYWGGIDLISSKNGFLNVHLVNGKILKVAENSPVTKLKFAPKDTLLQPPWVKYFKYDDKDQIVYAENRVVDIVLISKKYNAIYLIDRKAKPQGLAIPGGFIDEDEKPLEYKPEYLFAALTEPDNLATYTAIIKAIETKQDFFTE